MKALRVNEAMNFRRGQDAHDALGVGNAYRIEKWFEEYAPDNHYEIYNGRIRVYDHLDLERMYRYEIDWMPDNLEIRGSLMLPDVQIKELGKNIWVGNSLSIVNNKLIKTLPKDLVVRGNIHTTGSTIEYLPDDFKVGGNLDLHQTNLKKLPKGLKVGKSLDISDTNVTEIPPDLEVGNTLYMKSTKIKLYSIPDTVKIGSITVFDDDPR